MGEFRSSQGGVRGDDVDWGHTLVASAKAIAAGDVQPLLFDTFLDAALRTCDRSPGERSDLANEILPAIRGLHNGSVDVVYYGLRGVVDVFAGAPSTLLCIDGMFPWDLLSSVLGSIQAGVARPFLAMPTATDGSIDVAVLNERETALLNLPRDAQPDPCERLAAELRCRPRSESIMATRIGEWAPESGRWATPTIDIEWTRQASRGGTQYAELIGPSNGWAGTAWMLSLVPHQPDIAVAHAMCGLRDSTEREPKRFAGDELLPLLRRYADPNVTLGRFAPLVLALGVCARSALHRSAAMDAVLSCIATGRVRIEALQTTLTQLIELGIVKQSRCRTVAREIATSDAGIGDAITAATGPKRAAPEAQPRATANYRTMLQSVVGPALAERGFTGTLEAYERTDDNMVIEIAFQRHRMVFAHSLTFTINLAQHRGDTVLRRCRIGQVAAPPTDMWWKVTDDTDTISAAATAVLAAIDQLAIPALTAGLNHTH